MKAAGDTVSLPQADVSKKRDADRPADEAIRLYQRIDVLCSNAGVYPAASLESMTEDN
jgi:3-oxoacyl-[acyl-carrier protein] reductase